MARSRLNWSEWSDAVWRSSCFIYWLQKAGHICIAFHFRQLSSTHDKGRTAQCTNYPRQRGWGWRFALREYKDRAHIHSHIGCYYGPLMLLVDVFGIGTAMGLAQVNVMANVGNTDHFKLIWISIGLFSEVSRSHCVKFPRQICHAVGVTNSHHVALIVRPITLSLLWEDLCGGFVKAHGATQPYILFITF